MRHHLSSKRDYYGGIAKPAERPLDRDRLSMVNRDQAVLAAQSALDGVQRFTPEQMVAGVSILFAAVCRRCGLDPQTEHKRGMRLLAPIPGHDKDNKSLQSLQDFAGIRIMGEEEVSIS